MREGSNGFLIMADEKRNECLLETEALFVENKEAWFAEFAESFMSALARVKELGLGELSSIEYTMLYTNFINRKYISEIRAYGRDGYFDKKQRVIGEYGAGRLFSGFDKLWNALIKERDQRAGEVSTRDVGAYTLGALPDFYSYLASIARFAIAESVESALFKGVEKTERFVVAAGPYMAATEFVFIARKNKDIAKILRLFDEKDEKGYVFEDYSGLDFSGRGLIGLNLHYSQFRRALFAGAVLRKSVIKGACFRNANMERCCLDQCVIHEADFTKAKMSGASLVGARGRSGPANTKKWEFVGFLPVIFREADLTGANFTEAYLQGADFRLADLTGADFSGAELTGADFTGARLDNTNFDGAFLENAKFGARRKNELILSSGQAAAIEFI